MVQSIIRKHLGRTRLGVNFTKFLRGAFSQFSIVKKLQTQTATTEKQDKTLLYKKAAYKMLVNLTLGVPSIVVISVCGSDTAFPFSILF